MSDIVCTNGAAKKGLKRPAGYVHLGLLTQCTTVIGLFFIFLFLSMFFAKGFLRPTKTFCFSLF